MEGPPLPPRFGTASEQYWPLLSPDCMEAMVESFHPFSSVTRLSISHGFTGPRRALALSPSGGCRDVLLCGVRLKLGSPAFLHFPFRSLPTPPLSL